MPDPADVDAGRRHDGFDVLEAGRGLDQRDHQRAFVGALHRRDMAAAGVICRRFY
jgi:hypothetical protein